MRAPGEKRRVSAAIETMASIVQFNQLATVGLILALAERKALDPTRVFSFYELLADAIGTGPVANETTKASARMLRGIEDMARRMTTAPTDAGRA